NVAVGGGRHAAELTVWHALAGRGVGMLASNLHAHSASPREHGTRATRRIMKITDLKIDGFGVWHDLTLRGMSPELTVFYGPNEAGKSTLMQFMRSILYGMSPQRREKYLPPIVGGRPGGRLK